MSVWQKRARFGVALVFVATAVVVYFAIGRRPPQAAPIEVTRVDPMATSESSGCTVARWRGDKRVYELTCETQLGYPDGNVRMIKVTIRVIKDDGRSYVVTAGQAQVTRNQNNLQLLSGVKLTASDGFEMVTDRATYTREQGVIHSDVEVSFTKGRMSGSGTAIDYNENSDVLTIGQQAKVVVVNEQGTKTLDFSAGTAVLDRFQDVLMMDGGVHVLREQQVMDAARAVARLSPDEEFITFIELRGDARVSGGGGTLDAMGARDIDLDYTDDGTQLERVALIGSAGVTLTGTNGAAGRQLSGELLDIRLAPDETVTSAVGQENVRMVLPAAAGAPARSVKGRTLNASGQPGQGLTSAHFAEAVEYNEDATESTPKRAVRARSLDLALSGDVVSTARFLGDVTFEEPSFRAQAADARYDPGAGTLHLTGSDARGLPCVADDQISVDAETIDVTVESRRLKADRRVKTTIRPRAASGAAGGGACAVARQRAASAAPASATQSSGETRLPGLLQQDQVATVTADALESAGTGKSLAYTGNASLFQGDTTLRGNVIRLDQERGDLVVTGKATSRIAQGMGDDRALVRGTAEEIRYSDEQRMISYLNAPAGAEGAGAGKPVHVNGPEGDLSADKVEVILNKDDGRADRLEAYRSVTAKIDTKTVTADRLTYRAETGKYEMQGSRQVPVRITYGCGEASGNTVIYDKAANTIQVRGNDQSRTQSKSVACPASPAPAR